LEGWCGNKWLTHSDYFLVEGIPQIIETGFQLLEGLVMGLLEAIPKL